MKKTVFDKADEALCEFLHQPPAGEYIIAGYAFEWTNAGWLKHRISALVERSLVIVDDELSPVPEFQTGATSITGHKDRKGEGGYLFLAANGAVSANGAVTTATLRAIGSEFYKRIKNQFSVAGFGAFPLPSEEVVIEGVVDGIKASLRQRMMEAVS